jgi:exopolysaccharide production protein ExoY
MRTQYSARASFRADVVHPGKRPLGGPWKRVVDVTVGGIALITLTPTLLASAGLIRLLLGRPIIVAEERIGYKGKTFNCYAFRTTVSNVNSGRTPIAWRPYQQATLWAKAFGQALRASGLEQLPRLFNVVRGDMSLIGPRPIGERELLQYRVQVPEYFSARPGLTGLWCHVDWRRSRLGVERYYVRYWSMRLDLALLLKTIFPNSSIRGIALESRRAMGARRDLT